MKNFFKYAMMLVAVVMSAVVISSCSKDDDDNGGDSSSSNKFVGTWLFTPVDYYGRVLKFTSDGTVQYYNVAPDGDYETVVSGWKRCSNIGTIGYILKDANTAVSTTGDVWVISGSTLWAGDQNFRKVK